jgi:hypothetical protein
MRRSVADGYFDGWVNRAKGRNYLMIGQILKMSARFGFRSDNGTPSRWATLGDEDHPNGRPVESWQSGLMRRS